MWREELNKTCKAGVNFETMAFLSRDMVEKAQVFQRIVSQISLLNDYSDEEGATRDDAIGTMVGWQHLAASLLVEDARRGVRPRPEAHQVQEITQTQGKDQMKITKTFLKRKEACAKGILFWESLGSPSSPVVVFRGALASREFGYCEWLIEHCFPDLRSSVELSVFAAELCLPLFERDYPSDGRPREALESAKAWLADPSEVNVARCRASSAAADAAAAYSSYASAAASYSSAFAAYAAAYSSAYAASTSFAADAADANGDSASLATWEKIATKFEEILEREKPVKKTTKKKPTTKNGKSK